MSLVEITGLSKRYGESLAVDNLDLSIDGGQIFGLLGPNGAGKTTTISMVAGVVTPSSGRVTVAGYDLVTQPRAARRAIGLVPQDLALYEELSARQNLRFFGSLYELRGNDLRDRIDWVLDVAGLRDRDREPVQRFSGGMKRRLNLAVGLLHQPQLLILDEPTVGVDPQSRNHIFESIRRLRDEHQMTVLYTSHYMEEVESLCKRVAIMDHGKVIASDTVEKLLAAHGSGYVEIEFEGHVDDALRVASLHGEATAEARTLRVIPSGGFGPLVLALEQTGVTITSMRTLDGSLETLFLGLTGHRLRDD